MKESRESVVQRSDHQDALPQPILAEIMSAATVLLPGNLLLEWKGTACLIKSNVIQIFSTVVDCD
jgi:hypothetical protein